MAATSRLIVAAQRFDGTFVDNDAFEVPLDSTSDGVELGVRYPTSSCTFKLAFALDEGGAVTGYEQLDQQLTASCLGGPDGVLEPGEDCDDNNRIDGDGCDSNCTLTSCGNGIRTAGEQCDDGNLVDGDCCSATCEIEVQCQPTPASTATPGDSASQSPTPSPSDTFTPAPSPSPTATPG